MPECEKLHHNIHISHIDMVKAPIGLRKTACHFSRRLQQPPSTVVLDEYVKSCGNSMHVANMACDETGVPRIIYVHCVAMIKESGKRSRVADLDTVISPPYKRSKLASPPSYPDKRSKLASLPSYPDKRSKLASLPSYPVLLPGRPLPPPPPLFVVSKAKSCGYAFTLKMQN
jgi:hypothetical protein